LTIIFSNKRCLKPHRTIKVVILFFLFFSVTNLKAEREEIAVSIDNVVMDTVYLSNTEILEQQDKRPNPVLNLFKIKQKKNKRITAAILAFPLPFGIVGLHRIYLGTSPHVPVVYIGSLGGIFGILPFIDFCVLILGKNVDRYIENKKVFMWVN